MIFSGELFTYDEETRSTAFESGPKTDNVVVFVGGLGDGYNSLSFLKPISEVLSNKNWALVQVQLQSSYDGWGTSNLKRDSNQLDTLVKHLKLKRGKKRIVFLGHSTGSQDCYWHNKYGETSEDVVAYILQAPVSDRENYSDSLDGYQKYLDLATKLKQEGKGHELMPIDTVGIPITADRFYSLAAKGGDDDVFSTDFTGDEIKKLYENINRPIYWVYSEKDEFYRSKVEKEVAMKRFQTVCPAIKETFIIPEADHRVTQEESQKVFFKIIEHILTHVEI